MDARLPIESPYVAATKPNNENWWKWTLSSPLGWLFERIAAIEMIGIDWRGNFSMGFFFFSFLIFISTSWNDWNWRMKWRSLGRHWSKSTRWLLRPMKLDIESEKELQRTVASVGCKLLLLCCHFQGDRNRRKTSHQFDIDGVKFVYLLVFSPRLDFSMPIIRLIHWPCIGHLFQFKSNWMIQFMISW